MGFEVIKELAKQKETSLDSIAVHAGISYNSLSKIIRNTIKEPKYSTLKNIAEALGMTIDELNYAINPTGPLPYMLKAPVEINGKEQVMLEKYRDLDIYGQRAVDSILDIETQRITSIKAQQEQAATSPAQAYRFLTYFHEMASAGKGEYVFNDLPIDTIKVVENEASIHADFVISVTGDSMETTYSDGDKVCVQRTTELRNGDIGIFIMDNECFIKEVGEDGLISHNEKYPIMIPSKDVIVVGKVLGKAELIED